MSDPKQFLKRWSQRKLGSAEKQEPASSVETAKLPESTERSENRPAGPLSGEPPTEFDPATLPSLESIGAQTDVRPFLQAGVPSALSRAALRRAWSADPAIRDFIGLSENSWDFTAPDGVPGFGPLSADEIARLAGNFFNATPEEKADSAPNHQLGERELQPADGEFLGDPEAQTADGPSADRDHLQTASEEGSAAGSNAEPSNPRDQGK